MSYVKINKSWRSFSRAYVKVSGTWREAKLIYVRINGTWRQAHDGYTYSWFIGSYGGCTKPCGTGSQSRSVYCRRSDGVTVTDSKCTTAKPATRRYCNKQSCTTCPTYNKSTYTWLEESSFTTYSTLLYYGSSRPFTNFRKGPTTYNYGGYRYSRSTHKDSWSKSDKNWYKWYYAICRTLL